MRYGRELGDVASSLAAQKGKTKTNDQVLSLFKNTMSQKEGVIADLLGEGSEGYIAIYPAGTNAIQAGIKSQNAHTNAAGGGWRKDVGKTSWQ